eukprot:m.79964 g.79964  ORF g.79964 m.79964 type:complete len:320 (+) comp14646_c0_seq2:350-1309(+)
MSPPPKTAAETPAPLGLVTGKARLGPAPRVDAAAVLWRATKQHVLLTAWCTVFYLAFCPVYAAVTEFFLHRLGVWERFYFAAGTTATRVIAYAVINGLFFTAELKGWLTQYKVERKPYQQPTRDLVTKTFREAAINAVKGFFQLCIIFEAFRWTGSSAEISDLPSAATVFWQFSVCDLINITGFYWSHRLLHYKPLYIRFHKQHHEYTGPVSLSAEYAHPIEQVLANALPTIGGALFFGFHYSVWWVWLFVRLYNTYVNHSGFYFRGTWLDKIGLGFAEPSMHHDFHHSHNQGNYGTEIWDWIGGTMQPYEKFRKEKAV